MRKHQVVPLSSSTRKLHGELVSKGLCLHRSKTGATIADWLENRGQTEDSVFSQRTIVKSASIQRIWAGEAARL